MASFNPNLTVMVLDDEGFFVSERPYTMDDFRRDNPQQAALDDLTDAVDLLILDSLGGI
jgi:hypothetical protein